jgi:hypothetical protein
VDLPSVLLLCAVPLYAWYTLHKLRRRNLSYLGQLSFTEVTRDAVPAEVLAVLDARRLDALGLTSLGIVAVHPAVTSRQFSEVWADETRTIQAHVIWSQRLKKPRVRTAVSCFSFPADPTSVRVVEVTDVLVGVTSGDRPGDATLRMPGVGAAELLGLHRRQVAALSEPLLRFPDLRSAAYLLERSASVCQQWRTTTGRMQGAADGSAVLSRSQCMWFLFTHDLLLRPAYRLIVRARGRRTARKWPVAA